MMLMGAAGCAATDSVDEGPGAVYDPIEPVNRAIFAGNEVVDTILIRPVAETYRDYFPEPLQDRARDMLRHLRSPLILANELMQGDFEGAGNVMARFFINSVAGLGGFVDVANHNNQGIPFESEDFGQTLAVWGVDSGPYLVLPIIGPSNVRDTVGFVVETLADPISITSRVIDSTALDAIGYGRLGLSIIDARARTIDATDELRATSVDFYATIRSLYTQFREAEIRDGEIEQDIPDIPDYTDFSETESDEPPAIPTPAEEEEVSELPPVPRLDLAPDVR